MTGSTKFTIEDVLQAWPADIIFHEDAPWPIFLEVANKLKPKAAKVVIRKLAFKIRFSSRLHGVGNVKSIGEVSSCSMESAPIMFSQICKLAQFLCQS